MGVAVAKTLVRIPCISLVVAKIINRKTDHHPFYKSIG